MAFLEITVEKDPANPRFLLLIVDKEPWKKVHKGLFSKYLPKLQRLEQKDLEQKWKELEEKAAHEETMRLLAARSYFCAELRQKLIAKGISSSTIDKILEEYGKRGYLNDGEEARRLAHRLKQKGYGPLWIKARLQTKGYRSEEDFFEEEAGRDSPEEVEAILCWLEKRKKRALTKDPKEKHKLILSLQRRGFTLPSISRALKEFARVES